MKSETDQLLTCKELAGDLNRSISYIYAMKARGFMMPGGRSTRAAALAWLVRNPAPKSRK